MLTVLLPVLLPIATLGVLVTCFGWVVASRRTLLYLITVPLVLCSGTLLYAAGVFSSTMQWEAWDYATTAVRHYEAWDEEVPCRHTKYRSETRTRTVSDGHGGKQTETYTEQVSDGTQHRYDIDSHPEHWTALLDNGKEAETTRTDFDTWSAAWGRPRFVDMNRRYHSVDGDLWESTWPGAFDLIRPHTEFHLYENRVRASRTSAFRFKSVPEAVKRRFPLPADGRDAEALHAFGVPASEPTKLLLRRVNAVLGPKCQAHALVYLFDAKADGRDVVEQIKGAWQGPNKNEIVVCLGLTGQSVTWCEAFSWMDNTTLHAHLRQTLEGTAWRPQALADLLLTAVPAYWHRKAFKDFAYLSVDQPAWAVVLTWLTATGLAVMGVPTASPVFAWRARRRTGGVCQASPA